MMFKSMFLSCLVLVTLISLPVTHAHAKQFLQLKTQDVSALEDPYFQIKSMTMTEIPENEMAAFNYAPRDFVGNPPIPPIGAPSMPGTGGGLGIGGVISIIDQIIAVGQKIIPIIKSGSPVVNNNPMASVSVLPRIDAKDPAVHDMGGWSIPKSSHYKVSFKNGFGSEVVTFIYSITYQYNGSLDGNGKYLAGIRASASEITILWGFDLDASSQLLQISNVGTKQNVIAGATIEMSYTVKNWTKNLTTTKTYFVTGDGKLYPLD